MPNARVGALPQTSSSDEMIYRNHHDRGRGGRQQGITMQDLKKQTAIRLAEEHHQIRSGNKQNQQAQNMHYQRSNANKQSQKSQQQASHQYRSQKNMYPEHQSQYSMRRNDYNNLNSNMIRNQSHNSSTKNFPSTHHGQEYATTQNNYNNVNRAPYQSYRVNDSREMPNVHNSNPFLSQTRQHQGVPYSTPAPLTNENTKIHDLSMAHYHKDNQYAGVSQNSSLQVAAGKAKNTKMSNNLRYTSNVPDTSSVVSTTSSKSSRGGSSSNSISAHSSIYSRTAQHQQHLKIKQQTETSLHLKNSHNQQTPYHHQHSTSGHRVSLTHENNSGAKSNSSIRRAPNTQNKLPHGLTVHELKEMTRARLAAEAGTEKSSQSSEITGTDDLSQPYVEQQIHTSSQVHRNQVDRRAKCRPLGQSASAHSAQNWHRMFPQQDYQGTKSTTFPHRQHQRKNHPRVHHNQNINTHLMTGNQNQLSFGNRIERNRPHLDSVDSCSVTSFNSTIASEYMGSETASSVLPGHNIQQPPNKDDISFVRSWSYPSTSIGHTLSNEGIPSSSSFFDSSSDRQGSLIGSRRRLGSSPPGLYLEVPHEDQPLSMSDEIILPRVGGSDNPGMRTFDELSQRSLDSSVSRSEKLQGLSPRFHKNESTSSYGRAPSQNDMKPDVLGSELQVRNTYNPPSTDRSRVLPSNEELSNWVAESVLGTPLLRNNAKIMEDVNSDIRINEGSERNGFDGIFRAQNSNISLSTGNVLTSAASHGYLYSDVSILGRSEGGSWGGSTSVKSAPDFSDFLNQDFSNLLSFPSGTEMNNINHYDSTTLKSRIDPELIDSPCSVNRVASSFPRKTQFPGRSTSGYLNISSDTMSVTKSQPSSLFELQRDHEAMLEKTNGEKNLERK